jgi:hypothetical protein
MDTTVTERDRGAISWTAHASWVEPIAPLRLDGLRNEGMQIFVGLRSRVGKAHARHFSSKHLPRNLGHMRTLKVGDR